MMKEEPARRNLWVALLAALILTSPFAVASGDEDDEFVPNVLTVDAATDEVTDWEFNNAVSTDIRVLNVASSADGYTLLDPLGVPVFRDQSSTYHGVVEFWYQVLLPGEYTVVKDHGTTDETVVAEFKVVQSIVEQTMQPQARPNSLEGPGGGGGAVQVNDPNLETDGGGGATQDSCNNWKKVDEKTLWTPLIINHAPYGGSSVASSGWSSGKSIMILPYSWGSSQISTTTLTINNGGETSGQFQLAKWGKYEEQSCSGSGTGRFSAKVIDWEPTGNEEWRTFDLWGTHKYTDSDDKTSVSGAVSGITYPSTVFQSKYYSKDAAQMTSNGGATTTHSVTSRTFSEVGGSVGFSSGGLSMEVLRFRATSSSSTYYEYTFPANNYCYHIDHLGRGDDGAWAFHRASYGSC